MMKAVFIILMSIGMSCFAQQYNVRNDRYIDSLLSNVSPKFELREYDDGKLYVLRFEKEIELCVKYDFFVPYKQQESIEFFVTRHDGSHVFIDADMPEYRISQKTLKKIIKTCVELELEYKFN